MAGRITVSTLNNDTGVLATQNGMTGIAKAWVNFNGTTATPSTIRDSFNVASITKNGTGDYTINFTTAMPNANYVVAGAANSDGFNYPAICIGINRNTAPTTSAVRIYAGYSGSQASNGGLLDTSIATVAIFSS